MKYKSQKPQKPYSLKNIQAVYSLSYKSINLKQTIYIPTKICFQQDGLHRPVIKIITEKPLNSTKDFIHNIHHINSLTIYILILTPYHLGDLNAENIQRSYIKKKKKLKILSLLDCCHHWVAI